MANRRHNVGQRANIVVIQDGQVDLYYCHWCAATLPADLFWGPEHAVAFARRQRDARTIGPEIPMRRPDLSSLSASEPERPGAEGWLDNAWAEGGAVIDLDQKTLILYGGEDIPRDIPLRRLYLELLEIVWQGWEVRWAHLGMLDMADHVGLPRRLVAAEFDPPSTSFAECIGYGRPYTPTIGSLLLEDQSLRLFPLSGYCEWILAAGPELVESMKEHPGYAYLPLHEWNTPFPDGGFHIDLREHSLSYWTAADTWDPAASIVPLWPGWRVEWLGDNYEAHLDRLGDRVCLPSESLETLLSWVESMVMHESSAAPSEAAQQTMFTVVRRLGYRGSLSLEEASDIRDLPPQDLRRRVFDQAIANWKRRQTS
jgi:hypothetical protein